MTAPRRDGFFCWGVRAERRRPPLPFSPEELSGTAAPPRFGGVALGNRLPREAVL